MNRRSFLSGLVGSALLGAACRDSGRPSGPPPRRRLLVLTETAGYRHASIPTAVGTLRALGAQGGWDIVGEAGTADAVAAAITADGLAQVDAVCFANTTGTLGFTATGRRAFYDWLARGGAYVGIHSAADTFHGDPEYLALLRGEFLTHGPEVRVEVVVQDATHPACRGLPPTFRIFDEIYEFAHWERSRVHTLLALRHHPQTGAPGDFPLAWTSRPGNGRMFYTALGHRDDVYGDALFRQHLRGGIEWALGLQAGNDTLGNPPAAAFA